MFDYTNIYPLFNAALVLYLPIVFGLKYFIDNYLDSNQKHYLSESLTLPWASWCFMLSVFSMFGTYHTGKYILFNDSKVNLFESDVEFWYHAFIVSKLPELLDTIFIVLRSKPLVALQWYHHWATLAICYYASFPLCDKVIVFFFLNYFVHSFMYFYFGIYCFVKGAFLRKTFGVFVNIIQTAQMFFAIAYGFYEYYNLETNGVYCKYIPDGYERIIAFYSAVAMYVSYFVLFVQVFYERSKRLSNLKKD
uniref:Very-long-chain 3-oxoacyl-CoA synthase n=1 Tax=viral metagenome TaxID=1070528 RepID=A0A6C0BE36_9ZZZZ